MNLLGVDLFGDAIKPDVSGVLRQHWGAPPFTVLDARGGDWQERKRAWAALGIKSELGRGEVMGSLASARRAQLAAPGRSPMPAIDYAKHPGARSDMRGQTITDDVESWVTSSIFDPALCEVLYRWFCPPGGQVLDPFAGGSVRGIVAGALGRRYYGVDLRPEQIDANRVQAADIRTACTPEWYCADSRTAMAHAPEADFVFSCPPYGDLEVYSEDPQDLSTMHWPAFLDAYRDIIYGACQRLRGDRFAAFVVGDFRDAHGHYRNFVSETIGAFKAAGLHLYNEAVLVTAVGSASVRAGRQFAAGRKLVKTHQNVLVFCKGQGKAAAAACGEPA